MQVNNYREIVEWVKQNHPEKTKRQIAFEVLQIADKTLYNIEAGDKISRLTKEAIKIHVSSCPKCAVKIIEDRDGIRLEEINVPVTNTNIAPQTNKLNNATPSASELEILKLRIQNLELRVQNLERK